MPACEATLAAAVVGRYPVPARCCPQSAEISVGAQPASPKASLSENWRLQPCGEPSAAGAALSQCRDQERAAACIERSLIKIGVGEVVLHLRPTRAAWSRALSP